MKLKVVAMPSNFADVVEVVKTLSIEDKMELRDLLEKYLIEARREEIIKNYQESAEEFRSNKLRFSSDADLVIESLEE